MRRRRRPRAWGGGTRDWDPRVAAALYEELPVGVIACGPQGANLVFNRRARELFEGSGEELPADDCAERYGLYTAGGDRMLEPGEIPLQRALRGERLEELVLSVVPRRGPRRVVSVSGGPIAGSAGRITGAVVVILDITARLAIEEELRFQSAIAEHMAEAVILTDAADGQILWVNQTAARMFGYAREELVGEAVARLNVATEGAPAARAAEILGGLERDGVWTGQIEHVGKEGGRFWASVSVSPFERAGHGTVWTSVHSDMTARRAVDEALRTAEERFRQVFDDGPAGIALVGPDLRLTDANGALCSITGFRHQELVGRRFEDLAHPADAPADRELAVRALAGEIPRHVAEARLITKAGAVVRVAQTAAVVRGTDDRPAGGIVIVDPIAAA